MGEMSDPERAGMLQVRPEGYSAFIPAPLPPDPPLRLDSSLLALLSDADRSLGRLDGAAELLPDPDLFVAMFVRQEAVLSSQVEGTQSSLTDLLAFEAGQKTPDPVDAREVSRYVSAMRLGLRELNRLPLSLRLIRMIHAELMRDARGEHATPGEFRRSQNWIGPAGGGLDRAVFVPPPVEDMHAALEELESFIHEPDAVPPLVHCALVHAQFETIHPFLDGNGRVGRLLITFQLVQRGILRQPLLYLSHYFKRHRAEYYDRLMAIRHDGAWEPWIQFFLTGVHEVSREATTLARDIVHLRERHIKLAGSERSEFALPLLEMLFGQPRVTARMVESTLGCTYGQANQLIAKFEAHGILVEVTGGKRNRVYECSPYISLFEQHVSTG